ncbi:MAG: endonuclease/exonuclease/phosphatase family protein, partial [Verrucomicrobiota bacterium]
MLRSAKTTWSFFLVLVGSCLQLEAVAEDDVTFVFYNLRNYLAMNRTVDGERLSSAPKPEKEIQPLIEGIKATQPDILGVCEIGSPDYLEDFKKRLADAGMDFPHTELLRGQGYDRNLAVLSKFPITESNSRDDYVYSLEGQEFPIGRGVLDVTVAISDEYPLRLIGLHLKSKRPVPMASEADMRLNEARLARQHIVKVVDKDRDINLLVFGDLNDMKHEAPVKAVKGRLGSNAYLTPLNLADQYGFRWTHHWDFADSYARIDFAMVSKGLSPEVDRASSRIHHWEDWDKASDHRPLVV